MALTLKDLTDHMKKFNDATIVIGPGAAQYIEPASKEELESLLTHKAFRRTPNKFWPFYREHILVNSETTQANSTYHDVAFLQKLGVVKNVVTQNTDGLLASECDVKNLIELHGSTQHYTCIKCKCHYSEQFIADFPDEPRCEVCGGQVRPNIIFFGENYKDDVYHEMKVALMSTHTLILIGVDYSEDPLFNLVDQYCEFKSMVTEDDKKMLVAIGTPEGLDLNEALGFFEFIVKDDCAAAISRLVNAFK